MARGMEDFKKSLEDALLEAPTIAAAWAVYERAILYKAGPVQVSESRLVFFAAADWMLRRVMHASTSISEDEAIALMQSFRTEVADWQREYKKEHGIS